MSGILATARHVVEGKLEWRTPRIECHSIATITAGTSGSCNDAGTLSGPLNNGGNCPGSDIRLKKDIANVGKATHGLKLYSFRYIGGDETFVGVMAQDVLDVKPEAVVTRADGFYTVDYDALGLKMISIDKWRATSVFHGTR